MRRKSKKTAARDRMIAKAREYTLGTYGNKFVAKELQRLIRAEAAAKPDGYVEAVFFGTVEYVRRSLGQCVCVTCGIVHPWSNGKMHTGHFLGSRCNSILFEEDCVAPQCNRCNTYRNGMPQEYRLWMEHVRGLETIERLEKLKATTRIFTRGELVDMRIEYKRRMKEAERKLSSDV